MVLWIKCNQIYDYSPMSADFLTSDSLSSLSNNPHVLRALGNKEEFSGDFPGEMGNPTVPKIPPEHCLQPLLYDF